MKITEVRLGMISVPLRVPFKTALRTVESVQDVIVELHTDTGAVGYGEAPPTADEAGCGVGLPNVEARLKASYGTAADCVAGRPSAGGWLVRLTLPLTRG